MSDFTKDPNEIGFLKKNTAKKSGKPFLSGTIEGIGEVVCFENKGGWAVLKSRPREDSPSRPAAPRPFGYGHAAPVDDDDDVSF